MEDTRFEQTVLAYQFAADLRAAVRERRPGPLDLTPWVARLTALPPATAGAALGRLLDDPAHPELVDALLAACVGWDYSRWTALMLADWRLAPFYRPDLAGGLAIGYPGDPVNGAPPDLGLWAQQRRQGAA
jgi:hypothetical protein